MTAEIVQLSLAPVDTAEHAQLPEPTTMTLASAPDVMSPETLSQMLDGVAVATLAEWRTKDKGKPAELMIGPVWVKVSGLIRYLKPDVVSWLDSHRVATPLLE